MPSPDLCSEEFTGIWSSLMARAYQNSSPGLAIPAGEFISTNWEHILPGENQNDSPKRCESLNDPLVHTVLSSLIGVIMIRISIATFSPSQ